MAARIQIKNILGKRRFGDARDAYIRALAAGESANNPCTSKSLSTMPRRPR